MSGFKFNLGAKVKDKLSTFAGIVYGRHEYLYGCRTYTVKPDELHEGKPVAGVGFDEDQLELVSQASEVTGDAPPTPVPTTGGPDRSVPPVDR